MNASELISLVESGYDPIWLVEDLSPGLELFGYDEKSLMKKGKRIKLANPNSNAYKMLTDVKKEYEGNKEYQTSLALDLTWVGDNEVELSFIHVVGDRGSGLGSRALDMLAKLADKYRVTLTGQVHSNPKVFGKKTLAKDKLTAWYLRHGFVMKGRSKDKVLRPAYA